MKLNQEYQKKKKILLQSAFKTHFADTPKITIHPIFLRSFTSIDSYKYIYNKNQALFVHTRFGQKQCTFGSEKKGNIMTGAWIGPSLFLWIIRNKILL